MTEQIEFSLNLDLTNSNPNIEKYVSKFLLKKNNPVKGFAKSNYGKLNDSTCSTAKPYWNEDFYKLNNIKLYKHLSLETQNNITKNLSDNIINEVYYIEKSGLAYASRMVLSAETIDESQIYAHVSSDEAKHLYLISQFHNSNTTLQPSGFIDTLSHLIEKTSPKLLPIATQVILEGWGLSYYKSLRDNCLDTNLAGVFTEILQDEALHYTSAEEIHLSRVLNQNDLKYIKECFKLYLEMVRIGDFSIVTEVNKATGGLTKQQLCRVYNELNSQQTASQKLQVLSNLMLQPGLEGILQELKDEGYMQPYSNQINSNRH